MHAPLLEKGPCGSSRSLLLPVRRLPSKAAPTGAPLSSPPKEVFDAGSGSTFPSGSKLCPEEQEHPEARPGPGTLPSFHSLPELCLVFFGPVSKLDIGQCKAKESLFLSLRT